MPFYQGRPLPVPVDASFYGLTNADYEKYQTAIATATYIHRFTPATQIKNVLRYGDYQRDLWPTAPRLQGNPNPLLPTSVITRGRPGRAGRRQGLDQPDRLHDQVRHRQHQALRAGRAWSSRARTRGRSAGASCPA